ncbi:MAG: transposase [Planctomycetes bacterium]|nr:transposase [Planctomycetota bacterium]
MAAHPWLNERRRRRPEDGVLYQVLQQHLATFLARTDAGSGPCAGSIPRFVRRELEDHLRCGQFAAGFARVYCPGCRVDELVAFSCKRRGFCPSCGGRRMADTAAWLVDRVFPEVPVRQVVLSLPFELRFLLARDPELLLAVRKIVGRSDFALQRRQARELGIVEPRPAGVNAVQLYDSALRLNPHFHALIVDGVFVVTADRDRASFHALPAPTDEQLARVTARIVRRVLTLLRGRGLLRDDGGGLQLDDERSALDACQAAAVRGRIAFGEHAGRAVPRWRDPDAIRDGVDAFDQQARYRGFSLHAATAVESGRREALERLCRYVLRPAIDQDRLAWTRDGQVVYRFKRPWKDGTNLVVFEPLVLIERLAALVPRPRKNLVTYHGAFAPGASYRDRVVPPPPAEDESPTSFRSIQQRPSTPRGERDGKKRTRRRYSWAQLMLRCSGVDVLVCPRCQTRRQLLTFITDPRTIVRILTHLDLPARLPPLAPPRAPPGGAGLWPD